MEMGKVLPFSGQAFFCFSWVLHSAGWFPPCHPSSKMFWFCCGGWLCPKVFSSVPPKTAVSKLCSCLTQSCLVNHGTLQPRVAGLEACCQLSHLAKCFILFYFSGEIVFSDWDQGQEQISGRIRIGTYDVTFWLNCLIFLYLNIFLYKLCIYSWGCW